MWHYLPFLPCGLALMAQVALITGTARRMSTSRTWVVTALLWLGAWFATLHILYGRTEGSIFRDFILLRDGGYWVGSAVMFSLPFIAVVAVRHFMLATPRVASKSAQVALGCVALAGWGLSPGLFSIGWVAGCLFAGYPACL